MWSGERSYRKKKKKPQLGCWKCTHRRSSVVFCCWHERFTVGWLWVVGERTFQKKIQLLFWNNAQKGWYRLTNLSKSTHDPSRTLLKCLLWRWTLRSSFSLCSKTVYQNRNRRRRSDDVRDRQAIHARRYYEYDNAIECDSLFKHDDITCCQKKARLFLISSTLLNFSQRKNETPH